MARKQQKFSLIIAAKDRASKVFGKVRKGFSALAGMLKKASIGIAAGIAATTTAITAVIAKVVAWGDNLAKTADRIGVTTEELAAMRHAAELSGIEVSEMDKSLQLMQRNLADAADGVGEAQEAFEKLGLSAEELKKKGPEKAMISLVDALGKVENSSERVQIAMDIFGRSGSKVLTLTADGLREATAEARQLGIALSREDAGALERINDAWTRIKTALMGAAIQFTTALLGPMDKLQAKVTEFAKSGQLKEWAREAARILINLVSILIKSIPQALITILEVSHKITQVFSGWGLIFNGLKQLLTAWSILVLEVFSKVNTGIAKILDLTNVGGRNDAALAKSRQFGQALQQDLSAADTKLQKLVAEQSKMITETDRQKVAIDGMKQSVREASSQFAEFADNLKKNTDAAIDEAKAADRVAESWARAGASKQKYINISGGGDFDRSGFSTGDIRDQERTE